jgi:BTB/POZ domain
MSSLLTAEIHLSEGTVDQVLHCADMLQLPVIKQACCQYLAEALNEQNVPRTLAFAER